MTLKTRLDKIERAQPTVPALVDWTEFQARMMRKMESAVNGQADPDPKPLTGTAARIYDRLQVIRETQP